MLKCGLVVFGDYEPGSMVTVDRKYFTADFGLFQNVIKSIACTDGGIVKNAAGDGLVAALEVRRKKLQLKKKTRARFAYVKLKKNRLAYIFIIIPYSTPLSKKKLFDEYKQEIQGSEADPMLHCILISNSLPHEIGVRHNLIDKYDNFSLDGIVQEMRKVKKKSKQAYDCFGFKKRMKKGRVFI